MLRPVCDACCLGRLKCPATREVPTTHVEQLSWPPSRHLVDVTRWFYWAELGTKRFGLSYEEVDGVLWHGVPRAAIIIDDWSPAGFGCTIIAILTYLLTYLFRWLPRCADVEVKEKYQKVATPIRTRWSVTWPRWSGLSARSARAHVGTFRRLESLPTSTQCDRASDGCEIELHGILCLKSHSNEWGLDYNHNDTGNVIICRLCSVQCSVVSYHHGAVYRMQKKGQCVLSRHRLAENSPQCVLSPKVTGGSLALF